MGPPLAALPSFWATITGTTAAAAGTTAAGAAAGAGAAGAAGAGAAAAGAAKGIGSKLATAALTGAAGALVANKLATTPPAPKAPPPNRSATVDASAQASRARNRAREAIFGGRRGTLLTKGPAAEGFNTGRKKLLGQ